MQWAHREQGALCDLWANGVFLRDQTMETIAANARAVGTHEALAKLINIEFEDLYGSE